MVDVRDMGEDTVVKVKSDLGIRRSDCSVMFDIEYGSEGASMAYRQILDDNSK